VIARHWRGRAPRERADAYEEHLRRETLPRLREIDGHAGVYVLRRELDGEVEFLVLTLWESLDAVRAFAGDDYETAVVPPEARRLLASFDEKVVHYEVAVDPRQVESNRRST
jgi:heme-degrading monooxygenase HmoA